jgi:integrase
MKNNPEKPGFLVFCFHFVSTKLILGWKQEESPVRVKVKKGRTEGTWVTDYRFGKDPKTGNTLRHIKTWPNKKAAEAYAKQIEKDHGLGVHTPTSQSPTMAVAAAEWIEHAKAEGREETTVEQYEQHARLHIVPVLGTYKLSELSRPGIERFKDGLLKSGMSKPMVKKVVTSLKAIISEAMRVGRASHNPALGVKVDMKPRRPLEVGVDIPTTAEIVAMMDKAPTDLSRTLVTVAAFSGMRSGELRGLRWTDVDWKGGKIKVRQAMTRYRKKKDPKSHAGTRDVPVIPRVLNALSKWKAEHGDHELVFATANGTPIDQANLLRRVLYPAVRAAALLIDGKEKYDLHSLRHFFASLCINRKAQGGLELPPKDVQIRMGHSSVAFTLDRYGHLFPSKDEKADLAAVERKLFAAVA